MTPEEVLQALLRLTPNKQARVVEQWPGLVGKTAEGREGVTKFEGVYALWDGPDGVLAEVGTYDDDGGDLFLLARENGQTRAYLLLPGMGGTKEERARNALRLGDGFHIGEEPWWISGNS